MVDNLTKEQRRKNMQAIRSQSQLENLVSKALWHEGLRFRKNTKDLYGKPDISIKKYKIVIFIDSCFWHGCPIHENKPLTNQGYWNKKIKRNRDRDRKVTQYYVDNNWNILRIWEHDLKDNFENVIKSVNDFIIKSKM
ncbi:very short patch repair endonuclease [Jeotgalibaca caeni]|uniref:very short patch repair endonuclease n=1 Tax=Jeotgalibaca caeni TaxID=3028623 RepID=UPI00237E2418|nr:very short patch repair endonuclease [Jeotgalibaca caeni]MDE1549488.1 very short patch repair endonuclease [Jeotgalibaca caeni]